MICQKLEPLLAGIATQTIHVGSASQAMALTLVITASISVQLLLHSHLKAFLRQKDMNIVQYAKLLEQPMFYNTFGTMFIATALWL